MSGLNITLSDGTVLKIKAGDRIDTVKAMFSGDVENIFEGIDANENGTLDAGELNTLETKLTNIGYTVEVAQDGKTPKKAYNDAIKNMSNRYNKDTLEANFKTDEADKWSVEKGQTLWEIAKKILEQEGLPTDQRSINDRIAQIAKLNGLNNVNNVRVGMKLTYKLTDEGIQKVKDAEGNSAVAFGGGTPRKTSGKAKKPASGSEGVKKGVKEGVKEGVKPEVTPPATAENESTITVSPNGLNMGKGMPVDKDGNELKDAKGNRNFKDPKFKAGGGIMKYTSGDKVMYQITIAGKPNTLSEGVKLSAVSIEELTKMKKAFDGACKEIKKVDANAADDVKAQVQAANIAALKKAVEVTGGNVQVIKNAAKYLKLDSFVDRTSDDYKAFVQDLILTRNADVLKGLLYKDNKANNAVLTNDKIAHEYLAGLYQEIRNQEKAGEPPLTDEQIALKEVVAGVKGTNGYKIAADTENGVHEKYMSFYNMDGTPMYQVNIDDVWYYARDEKVLDEFLTKLDAADTDDKKTALFKEYAKTTDPELAKCLARNAQTLKAASEDITALVNTHGADVIAELDSNITDKTTVDAVVARAKEIYTNDPGNLENAVYLENVMSWIDKFEPEVTLTEDEKKAIKPKQGQTQEQAEAEALNAKKNAERAKIKEEIAKTYFTEVKGGKGNVTYTFKPSRIPTKEEMAGLCQLPTDFNGALVKYTKLEDMGKGRYNEAIDGILLCDFGHVEHYAGMVDGMTKKEDVIDFIDNKVTCNHSSHLPFDKILEKFPKDDDIKKKLFEHVDVNSIISKENAKKFIDMCGKIS